MVDPNRRINRLTDEDIAFLNECEEEFAKRFSNEDHDFMEHCKRPRPDPPIVENWGSDYSGCFGGRSGGNSRKRYHSDYQCFNGRSDFNRSRSHWQWRGGNGRRNNYRYGREQKDNRQYYHHSMNKHYEHKDKSYTNEHQLHHNREQECPAPLKKKCDYINFVSASKD